MNQARNSERTANESTGAIRKAGDAMAKASTRDRASARHAERKGRRAAQREKRKRDREETIRNERDKFFGRASEFTPFLAVETTVGLFLVRTDDENVGRSLFTKQGRGEFKVLQRAMDLLERAGRAEPARAGTFIDVGANIGTTTIAALDAHGFGRVVALEPEPRNIKMLRLNLEVNGLSDQAEILPFGVSNAVGKARLHVFESMSGLHMIAAPDAKPGELEGLVDIDLLTLDSLVDRSIIEADGTGLVWIDAEGHEGHVLAGAGRLLTCGSPVILEVSADGLARQGGIDLLVDATNEHYTHFVDMRRAWKVDAPFDTMPVARLRDMISEYEESAASHTEILLLREG